VILELPVRVVMASSDGRLLGGPVHPLDLAVGPRVVALFGAHPGDVDVEVADRIALEGLLGGLVAFRLGQPADVVALEASVQAERETCGIVACRA
jgi:hypothetical protein